MTHTPGPWALAWEKGKHGVIGTDGKSEVKLLCIVYNDGGSREPERKANAQLMSAAPELLEVALLVLDEATDCFPQPLIDAASKAIAKARGGG